MHRLMIARLGTAADMLIHRQSASDHVNLSPMLDGEAVDELLMVNARTRSAPRPAPDPHHCRLSSGARRNLPHQTIEMPLGLASGADCFR